MNTEFAFSPIQILQPALPGYPWRTVPMAFGASLSLARGQAMARKTSDGKAYPLNIAASDGTQIFAGFSQYACSTDGSGNVLLNYGSGSGSDNFFSSPMSYGELVTGGVINPNDVSTSATGTAVAEVDTITPTNPTTGDIYSVTTAGGDSAQFTVGATQTATATVTGLKNAWNANPVLAALATASGTATLILTAATKGQPLNLTAAAVGTGTTALVITTAAVAALQGEVDTFTPANPTTGDVYTLTLTASNLQTYAVSATVGATQTATAISGLLIAAWNANAQTANVATASGTATVILTATNVGSSLSVAGTVVGTGTISKVVTTATFGRNLADILAGNPGAHILQPYGYWLLP